MKVILREDVEALGTMGEVVNVRDGYGRNYLIPRGKAVLASDAKVAELEHHKAVIALKKERAVAAAKRQGAELAALKVEIPVAVGEQGKLYGSVTAIDIEEAVRGLGFKLQRRQLQLAEPIKELGTFDVPVRLHPEVTATLKVNVVEKT